MTQGPVHKIYRLLVAKGGTTKKLIRQAENIFLFLPPGHRKSYALAL